MYGMLWPVSFSSHWIASGFAAPWHAGSDDDPSGEAAVEVQVIVWVGLAILLAAVGAFVWLFVLGHGFDFSS